jgi:hypothetical protein
VMAAGGGQGTLNPKPHDQDGGERAIEILAHRVEEAEILGEQVVDGLEDELEIVYCLGSFGSGSVRSPTAFGSFATTL